MLLSRLHHQGVSYRADIDGLRAVAVLLVVGSHIGLFFYGGFVGVDVFFVISGYLISTVILSDISAGRFSLRTFYERRIRRIAPALFGVLVPTTLLAVHFLTPLELRQFAQSQLAAVFSFSNIFFWQHSGYFEAASSTMPLLHTWSLAVEEQFYLLFPLALLLIHRYAPARIKAFIWLSTLFSLLAAVWFVWKYPSAAFFLAPLRAWELLLGTLISQRYVPPIKTSFVRNLLAAVGLCMIVLPGIYYRDTVPFPGLSAVPPCLGAALIILAGETGTTLVSRLLSLKPVVFIGLISYSLYLWHWPLLVFQKISGLFFVGTLTRYEKLLLIVLFIAIAAVSWAFIEQPFRSGKFRPSRTLLFAQTGAVALLISVISAVLVQNGGWPSRFPEDARRIAAYSSYSRGDTFRDGTCYLNGDNSFRDYRPDTCLTTHPGKQSILLAGDSHAGEMLYGFRAAYPEADILQASSAACRPLTKPSSGTSQPCKDLFAFLYTSFLPQHRVNLLVLVARWQPEDLTGLSETIRYAKARGIPVAVIGPSIEYDLAFPRIMAFALRDGRPGDIEKHRLKGPEELDRSMAEAARTVWQTPYISMHDNLCSPECPLYAAPGVPLLFDTNHVTPAGAALFAQTIRRRSQLPLAGSSTP